MFFTDYFGHLPLWHRYIFVFGWKSIEIRSDKVFTLVAKFVSSINKTHYFCDAVIIMDSMLNGANIYIPDSTKLLRYKYVCLYVCLYKTNFYSNSLSFELFLNPVLFITTTFYIIQLRRFHWNCCILLSIVIGNSWLHGDSLRRQKLLSAKCGIL